MRTWEEITQLAYIRQQRSGPLLKKMADVAQRYNGDYVLPDPSDPDAPAMPALTPAIIQEAVDQPALRAASVRPSISVPAINPAKDTGKGSLQWAETRRKVYGATWYKANMPLLLRRFYRQLRGYGTACMVVFPSFDDKMPTIQLRDPLTAFPEQKTGEDFSLPRDVVFVYGKSAGWVRDRYPETRSENGGPIQPIADSDDTELWDCVEYVDEHEMVTGLLGPRWEAYSRSSKYGSVNIESTGRTGMELRRIPNRTGLVPVVIPQMISMDRVASQVAHVIGQVDVMARLMLLDIRAQEKSIWPDRYIIGNSAATPQVVGGRWKEGIEGEANILLDAQEIGELRSAPDPAGRQAQDRLERNARVSLGLIPQYGGESYGALRTGRGIDTLGSFAVDPRIQELQEIAEVALSHVNEAVAATYEGYWPDRKYTMFSGWPGDVGHIEFEKKHLEESHENVVNYPLPGSDVQSTTMRLGQLNGMKAISMRTLRTKHPDITDPDVEETRVLEEALDDLLLNVLGVRAQQGLEPVDAAMLRKAIRDGENLDEAMLRVDQAARERQAAEIPEPGDGQAAAPETQPGLGTPEEFVGPGGAGGGGGGNPLEQLQQLAQAVQSNRG